MYTEEKIASYTAPKKRIQLLKITELDDSMKTSNEKFQIRTNRKVTLTTNYEGIARKKFASIITCETLQQKIYF